MKRILNIYIPTIILLFALLTLVACSEPNENIEENIPASERGIGEVTMSVNIEKRLGEDTEDAVKYWEFMATPRFKLFDHEGDIVGRVDYWRQLSAITTPNGGKPLTATSLGRYMGGDWLFEVRALNRNGHVLYVGHTDLHVSAGKENLVAVTVYPDSADGTHGESKDETSRITGVTDKALGSSTTVRYGTLHAGFLTTRVDDTLDDMKITVTAQKMAKVTGELGDPFEIPMSWIRRSEGDKLTKWYENATSDNYAYTGNGSGNVPLGKVYYEGTYALDAGIYLVTYKLSARNASGQMIELGGQTVTVTMVGGEETLNKGYMTAGSFVIAGIKIAVPGTIYGTINGVGSVVSVAGNSVNLSWVQDQASIENSDEVPVSFEWYLGDQKLPGTSASITLDCPRDGSGNPIYGVYRVSLRPLGSAGSKGHTDIDVIFNPADKADLANYDWAAVRTYAETLEGIYDVDPGVTGNQIVVGYVKGNGTPVKWTSSTQMISYPYDVRVRSPKSLYSVSDVGLSPVYVTTASDLASSAVKSVWFGPTATLGSASASRCANVQEVRFVPNATKIQDYACMWMTGVSKVTVHSGITSTGTSVFKNCTKLAEITLPGTTFGTDAFYGCTSLERAYMTNTNISAANNMFYGCTSLWDVKMPEGVNRKIPDGMFRGCTSLTALDVPAVYNTVGSNAFTGSGLVEFTGTGITTVNASAFASATALKRVVITNVTSIGASAFEGCVRLGEAKVGSKLATLSANAFKGCSVLGTFEMPGTVVTVGNNAFQNCTSLSSVQFASGTTTIGTYAFAGCTSLNAVLTPATLTTIGANAYNGCTNLRHVIVSSAVKSIGANAFAGCTNMLEAEFKTTSGWKAGSTALTAAQMSNLVTAGTLLRSTYVASAWSKT